MRQVNAGTIYRATEGNIYDDERPEFDCYEVAATGNFYLVDAWVCDEHGNRYPEIDNSPVPVRTEALGEIIREA